VGHIITYTSETEKGMYCQIKFDSGDSVLIAMVGHDVKMFKLATGGLIPVKTIWRSRSAAASIRLFIDEDAPINHPVDAIQDTRTSGEPREDLKAKAG
jgi:hypothetical protein